MDPNRSSRCLHVSALFSRDALDGDWTAHCLDLDLVTQGTDPGHALAMLQEAVSIVVEEDLAARREPLDRNAPSEEWDTFFDVLRRGQPVPALAGSEGVFAAQVRLSVGHGGDVAVMRAWEVGSA